MYRVQLKSQSSEHLVEIRHCLAYSLGSQGNSSFGEELLEPTACQVSHHVLLFSSIFGMRNNANCHVYTVPVEGARGA